MAQVIFNEEWVNESRLTEKIGLTEGQIKNYRLKLWVGGVHFKHLTALDQTDKEMLKMANRSQFISHAPYDGIQALKVSKRSPDPLSFDEYQSFIAHLSLHHALIWTIATHTGIRHGELCAHSWEDVDLKNGVISVSRNLTRKGLFVPPKTVAGIRKIGLLRPAHDASMMQFEITGALPAHSIEFHHRERGKTEKQIIRAVFVPTSHSKKNRLLFQSSIFYGWKHDLRRAGIRDCHPY